MAVKNTTSNKSTKSKVTKTATKTIAKSVTSKPKAPKVNPITAITTDSSAAPAEFHVNPAVLIDPTKLHNFVSKITSVEEPKVKTSARRGRPAKSDPILSIPDVHEFFADGEESKSLSKTHSWNEEMWKRWKTLNKPSRNFCYNIYSIEIKAIKLLEKIPVEDRKAVKEILKSLIDNH